VVAFHAERALSLPQYVGHMPLGGATAFMHTGVDFFFVLSGYIIFAVHRADIGRPAALGYTAIEAADGPASLQVLRSDARIDLLVTDVGLPGGMNGRQVADAGRVVRPGLKGLFITGYAENAVISHGHLDAGMHVLTKPFAMEVLAGRIKELIAGR